MAFGMLPEPGKMGWHGERQIGPCVEGCDHPSCRKTREMSKTECEICGEPIGYETKFQRDEDGKLVHFTCNMEKYEEENHETS